MTQWTCIKVSHKIIQYAKFEKWCGVIIEKKYDLDDKKIYWHIDQFHFKTVYAKDYRLLIRSSIFNESKFICTYTKIQIVQNDSELLSIFN